MNKDVGTILGTADRCMYQLGDTTVRIDRLHKPIRGSCLHYVWQIRESRSHTDKRATEAGSIIFPHVHVSTIKLKKTAWATTVSGVFKTHGGALLSAIYYLNQKRKGGEL